MKNQEQLRQEAEKILNENLIGVNKEAVKKHHHFKKSIIDAMISFASTLSQHQPAVTDEEITIWAKDTALKDSSSPSDWEWIAKYRIQGAEWMRSRLITNISDEEIEEIANKAYPKALVESPHYKSEREGFIKGLRSRLQETKTTN
ncbi:MAG: hypothetical protein R3213_10305 [Flavobacteriaceae bacterium]|nr:hypothetical protein [Flavobacteriaceae bacterium]